MATVDVFVPCYNYGRFLRECVQSVLQQDGVSVRVLILDDCSSDDSEQVGRALAAEDSRVEYRRHEKNKGHTATYNEGIDWVSGDYCMLLSADDLLTPGALGRAAAVLDTHPEVGLTHGRAVWTATPETERHSLSTAPEVVIETGLDFIQYRCKVGHNYVECPTAIGRTSIQKRIGHYRFDLPHSGDMEMWLRYAANSSVASLQAHQAFYRTHGENMSTRYLGARDVDQIRLAFDAFFETHGRNVHSSEALKQVAYQSLSRNAFGLAYKAFTAGRSITDFRDLMRAASLCDPSVRTSRKWFGLRCKYILGAGLWDRARRYREWAKRMLARKRFKPEGNP